MRLRGDGKWGEGRELSEGGFGIRGEQVLPRPAGEDLRIAPRIPNPESRPLPSPVFRLDQRAKLSQQLRLAPRMIQSMEILQLPMPALEERIEQELESNVALEKVEPEGETDPAARCFARQIKSR